MDKVEGKEFEGIIKSENDGLETWRTNLASEEERRKRRNRIGFFFFFFKKKNRIG